MGKYKKNPYTKKMLCAKLGDITYDELNTKLFKIGYKNKKITEYNFDIILEKINEAEKLVLKKEQKELLYSTISEIEVKDDVSITYNQLVRQYNTNAYLLAVYESEVSKAIDVKDSNYIISQYANLQQLQMRLIKQINDAPQNKNSEIKSEFEDF